MAISALFAVNQDATVKAHACGYGTSPLFEIQNITGIESIAWSIIGTSKSTQAALSISLGGTPTGSNATVTMPADPGDGLGRSFLMKLRVTNQRGEVDTQYRIFGAANASGRIPFCAGEEVYRHATHGWTDLINEALNTTSGVAGASLTLQYNNGGVIAGAAGIKIRDGGTGLSFDAATSTVFLTQDLSSAATDTTRRLVRIIGQLVTGNTSTRGGTISIEGGGATGAGGTHNGGLARLAGGSAPGGSGTRNGGDAQVYGGSGGTRYGNVFIGTDLDPDTYNWQGMGRGIGIQDSQAVPSADNAIGHFYWSAGGNPFWRFNGTVLGLTGTAATANAGAGAGLPATVQGYITVNLAGTTRKIPYYAT